ncbi:Rv2175c family DNA-binding protein [Demequina maris]|uniref:Rv2175c family DNA-binding protein n=1 Tax=Demequina maris TaxID=1638982 RepID=UPI000783986F|nr:Rv2175c family DNA-binding protein [Demequina maris]
MTDAAWLTVPDFADRLGITPSAVREMLREGHLFAVRRGERQTLQIPADVIVEGDAGPEVLATLRGTLTLLHDVGMDDAECGDWLLAEEEELGMTPLEALRQGRRAHVRRVAQSLL